ncbi:hypothetical protein LLH00_15670 [bacterium]|nr:hypothetical protein [bacterium]
MPGPFQNKYPLLAALALSALLALACSDRPRSNPFDPRNPDHEQRLAGFNALAGNNEVLLYWDPLDYEDVKGMQVERVTVGNTDTTVISDSVLALDNTSFRDPQAKNGTTYEYRLRLLLKDSEERPVTENDRATPGPSYPWVSNLDRTAVTRLTPDFRDERYDMEYSFNFVQDIQVRPDNSEIWVLDAVTAKIYRFYFDGSYVPDQGNLGQTAAFRFNTFNHALWIASWALNSTVFRLSRAGELEVSYRTDVFPTWIELDYKYDGAWVATDENRMLYLESNGAIREITHSAFISPEKVVSGISANSRAWVLDYDAKAIFHLTIDDVDWNLKIFSNPQDIAANDDATVCWVADMDADIVYEIDDLKNIRAQVHNLGHPTDLFWDRLDQSLYVTGGDGTISCLQSGGTVLWQTHLNNHPGQIVVQDFN